jgi:hypothetical protein
MRRKNKNLRHVQGGDFFLILYGVIWHGFDKPYRFGVMSAG